MSNLDQSSLAQPDALQQREYMYWIFPPQARDRAERRYLPHGQGEEHSEARQGKANANAEAEARQTSVSTVRSKRSSAGQGRAGQSRAEQYKAEQSSTVQYLLQNKSRKRPGAANDSLGPSVSSTFSTWHDTDACH